MPSDVCKQRSCEPKERTVYIRLKRNGKNIVCVWGGGEGGVGGVKGTGEVIHLFQTVCVWGRGRERGRDSLISNCTEKSSQ